jgi:hypothetical protein
MENTTFKNWMGLKGSFNFSISEASEEEKTSAAFDKVKEILTEKMKDVAKALLDYKPGSEFLSEKQEDFLNKVFQDPWSAPGIYRFYIPGKKIFDSKTLLTAMGQCISLDLISKKRKEDEFGRRKSTEKIERQKLADLQVEGVSAQALIAFLNSQNFETLADYLEQLIEKMKNRKGFAKSAGNDRYFKNIEGKINSDIQANPYSPAIAQQNPSSAPDENESDEDEFEYNFEEEDDLKESTYEEDAGIIAKAKRRVDQYATGIEFLVFLFNYMARCPTIIANQTIKKDLKGSGSSSNASDQEKYAAGDTFSKEKQIERLALGRAIKDLSDEQVRLLDAYDKKPSDMSDEDWVSQNPPATLEKLTAAKKLRKEILNRRERLKASSEAIQLGSEYMKKNNIGKTLIDYVWYCISYANHTLEETLKSVNFFDVKEKSSMSKVHLLAWSDLYRTYTSFKKEITKNPDYFARKLAEIGDGIRGGGRGVSEKLLRINREYVPPLYDGGDEVSQKLLEAIAGYMYKTVYLTDKTAAYNMLPSDMQAKVPPDQIQDESKSSRVGESIWFKDFINFNEMARKAKGKPEDLELHGIRGNSDSEKIDWIIKQYRDPNYYGKTLNSNIRTMISGSIKNLILSSYNSWSNNSQPRCENPLKGTTIDSGSIEPKTPVPEEKTIYFHPTPRVQAQAQAQAQDQEKAYRTFDDIDNEEDDNTQQTSSADPSFDPSKATFAPKPTVSMDQTPQSEAERIFNNLKSNMPSNISILLPKPNGKQSKYVFDNIEDLSYEVPPDFDYEEWKDLLQKKINTLPAVAAKLGTTTKTESFRRFFNSLIRKN